MLLGMPTLIELDNLEQNIAVCIELGLDFIEINMNLPEFQVDQLEDMGLEKLAKEHGIFFTFHLADDLDIAHFNPNIRLASTNSVYQTLTLADKIKSPVVNMHMQQGVIFTLPTHKVYIYEKAFESYIQHLNEFTQNLPRLSSNTTKLCIENTGLFSQIYIQRGVDTLLQHPYIYLTLDVGHDYLSDYQDSRYMNTYLNKILHMHLHDAKANQDHKTLFEGELPILRYINDCQQNQLSAVIEVKTLLGLRESVAKLHQRLGN